MTDDSGKPLDPAAERADTRRRSRDLLEKIERWLEHLRAHGVTEQQMEATLGMPVPKFLRFITRDFFGGLERLQRLWPGAATWQVLRAAEELAGAKGDS